MKKERDSGIELLRVFAMLLVIGVHAFSYGGFYAEARAVGGHVAAAALLMKLATRAAVNIFVIITGYFMVRAPFDPKKNLRRAGGIYQKMLVYSVVLTAVFLVLGPACWVDRGTQFSLLQVVLKGLTPVTSQTWYFLTDYLLLCLLVPFVNLALQKLTKRQYTALALGLFAFMSVWMTLVHVLPFRRVIEPFGYSDLVGGKQVFHFLFIYVIGGWLGRFCEPRKRPQPLWLCAALGTVLLNYLLFTRLPSSCGFQGVAGDYANPLLVLNAVCLLLFFKDLHFKSRIVNALGGATLGVYALTEFRYLRTVLWNTVSFKKMDNGNLWLNFVHVALVLCGVFLAAAAVDLLVSRLLLLLRSAVQKIKLKKVKQSS
jgi:surface polysaccharide O-acyltransferase-like enzyme